MKLPIINEIERRPYRAVAVTYGAILCGAGIVAAVSLAIWDISTLIRSTIERYGWTAHFLGSIFIQ